MGSPIEEKLNARQPLSSGTLGRRVATAALLIPIVLAGVYFGGRIFAGMVAFLSIVMIFEWTRMVERREFSVAFYILSAASAVSLFLASAGGYVLAFAFTAFAGLVAFFAARRESVAGDAKGLWTAFAACYLIAPCIALLWLRFDAPNGKALTFLLFFVVWAADSGAFFLGKYIGGPKISYALSPSKTWAGIGGGVLGGAIAGAGSSAFFLGMDQMIAMICIGGALGAASVIGDLAESAFKRNFGLKDISGFIPGHGGALDRLDGMIFATTAMTSVLFLYMVGETLLG